MEDALKNYLVDELEIVNTRIEEMSQDIKNKLGMMNLEMGKLEGVLIGQKIRRDELMDSLGIKQEDFVVPEEIIPDEIKSVE